MSGIYKRNLNYVKDKIPGLYNALNETDTSNIKVTVVDENINIRINDQPLYPANSSEYLGKKIENFFNEPSAFYRNPPKVNKEAGGAPADIHDGFIVDLEKKLPLDSLNVSDYDQYLDSIPVLIMFGIGTGIQIQQLMSFIDIKSLFLLDEDYKMIKASMHIIDWVPIFEHFMQPTYSINIITGKDSFKVAAQTLNNIYNDRIYLSYYINYFHTYKTPYFKDVYENILKLYSNLFTGWGLYDDEIQSLTHTIKNLEYKLPLYTGNKHNSDIKEKVFIIGSGPSIDEDIENIQKHKDDAFIVSCGSALRVLQRNDIVPDLHFEIERTPETHTVLTTSLPKEYLDKISFIGLNSIYPDIFSLFKSSKIFFRDNDCGASIIPNSVKQVEHTNPTVLNGALAFVTSMGFKNIYLFGADMGYKDESLHHSKDTIYGDKGTKYAKRRPRTMTEFEGNFDRSEKILSSDVFSWCKQRAENCIASFNDINNHNINFYNCSDGAYIKGTNPIRSKDIVYEKVDKSDILKKLDQCFVSHDDSFHVSIQKKLDEQKQHTIDTINYLVDYIDTNKITTYSSFFSALYIIYNKVVEKSNEQNKSTMSISLLRGTIIAFICTTYTRSLNAKTIEESFEYIGIGLSEIKKFLLFVKKEIHDLG